MWYDYLHLIFLTIYIVNILTYDDVTWKDEFYDYLLSP